MTTPRHEGDTTATHQWAGDDPHRRDEPVTWTLTTTLPARAHDGSPLLWKVLPVPPRGRIFTATWGTAAGLCTLGGAGCGAVSLGVSGLLFFAFAGLVGMVVGAALGLVVGAGLAAVLTSAAPPPRSPTRLHGWLAGTGLVLGAAPVTVLQIALVGNASFAGRPGDRRWAMVLLALNAALAVIAAAVIGWCCGSKLARSHLARFGLAPDDSPPVAVGTDTWGRWVWAVPRPDLPSTRAQAQTAGLLLDATPTTGDGLSPRPPGVQA